MNCYDAFCEAHRKIVDHALKAMRSPLADAQEQHQLFFRHQRIALHLAYSQAEINDVCEKHLKIYRHK